MKDVVSTCLPRAAAPGRPKRVLSRVEGQGSTLSGRSPYSASGVLS
jgi:hypothetical protein